MFEAGRLNAGLVGLLRGGLPQPDRQLIGADFARATRARKLCGSADAACAAAALVCPWCSANALVTAASKSEAGMRTVAPSGGSESPRRLGCPASEFLRDLAR
jgi:hypothetical protein